MNRLSSAEHRSSTFNWLSKSLLGLSLLAPAASAFAQFPAPNQYPQNPAQTNGYYGASSSGQPMPGQTFAPTSNNQPQLEPVFIRLQQFDIPLNVNSRGTNQPAEVQLFVSTDSGRNWEFYSRQSPSAGRFTFSAPGDGDYWFAVRPGNGSQGTPVVPAASLAPSLRVAVDTTQPQLQVQSAADASGIVNVQFSIADNAPSTNGIQIYYQTDTPNAEWLLLDANRIQWQRGQNNHLEGQIGFDPHVDWRRISLHLVATDQAGNQTTAQKVIERPRVAGTQAMLASAPMQGPQVPGPNSNNLAPPVNSGVQANGMRPTDTGYAVVSPQPTTYQNLYNPAAPTNYPPAANYQDAPSYQTTEQQAFGYRGMTGQPQGVNSQPRNSNTQRDFEPRTSPANFAATERSHTPTSSAIPSPSSAFRSIDAGQLPVPANQQNVPAYTAANKPNTNAVSSSNSRVPGSPNELPAPEDTQPNGENLNQSDAGMQLPVSESEINFSRQAEFSLDYEFDAVGPREIKRVELWGTRDAGKTWNHWGADPDNLPPFDVSVSGQGLYGFRIVVIDNQNLTSPTPQPGDEPEIYILVDNTAPLVKLVSASYGEGAEAGSLIIEYTYKDERPIARPISLSFSDSTNGPWTTIATGLENTGRYVWPADPRLHKDIYLRVEGTDRAGNTGIEVNPTPVSLRGLAPTARIKGFQPLTQDR